MGGISYRKNTITMQLEITTLNDGWHDADEIILHACFQCLVNWVEKENGLTHCVYTAHKEQMDECTVLYNWWKTNHVIDYDNEETDKMLQRLINIKNFLWT